MSWVPLEHTLRTAASKHKLRLEMLDCKVRTFLSMLKFTQFLFFVIFCCILQARGPRNLWGCFHLHLPSPHRSADLHFLANSAVAVIHKYGYQLDSCHIPWKQEKSGVTSFEILSRSVLEGKQSGQLRTCCCPL